MRLSIFKITIIGLLLITGCSTKNKNSSKAFVDLESPSKKGVGNISPWILFKDVRILSVFCKKALNSPSGKTREIKIHEIIIKKIKMKIFLNSFCKKRWSKKINTQKLMYIPISIYQKKDSTLRIPISGK